MQFRALFVCLVAATSCVLAADSVVVDEIIAKVNGDIITRSEIDHDRKNLETEIRKSGGNPTQLRSEIEQRSSDLLRERIDGLLLVSKGKELNINVESELSKYMADLRNQSKIVDEEKFQQYVHEQTGMTWEDYKNEVRNGMLKQRVIREQVGRGINTPRPELQKYYEEHKAEFVRQEQVFLREIVLST